MTTAIEPNSDHGAPAGGGDREFGLVFAFVFAVLGCWPVLRHEMPRWWILGVAFAFCVAALAFPRVLHRLNRFWARFGQLLHRVVSPIVMGTIFFACVTPTAWLLRRRGKDILSLKWDPALKSYWIERSSGSPDTNTMIRQF